MKKDLEQHSKSDLIALLQVQNTQLQNKDIQLQEQLNHHLISEAKWQAENNDLKDQIAEFKRLVFGQSRERFITVPPEQLLLPFEPAKAVKEAQEEAIEEKISYTRQTHKKKHPGRAKLPKHLPVEEVEIYPEADLSQMVCIGKEITEELECVPARFFIKRYIRYKYAPKQGEGSHAIGMLPERVIDKGIPGVGLLAFILINKYLYHLPLDRQLKIFRQEGVIIKAGTINGWVKRCAQRLEILYDALVNEVKNQGYLRADETTLKVLDKQKKGTTHLGYFWVYHAPIPRVVLFDYHPSRGYIGTKEMLADFEGYLQSDGYSVYAKVARENQLIHLGCWTHVRREFKKALSNDKQRAEKALTYIQQLYAIERQARKEALNPEQTKVLRLRKALPIINEMGEWIAEEQNKTLPQSTLGKAFTYCTNRWRALSNYLLEGNLQIDNNLTENALRVVALGRKNYLFAGSHEAAKRAAIFYTFTANCNIHQVNPQQWFTYVLENILNHPVEELHQLFPQNFKEFIENNTS